MIHRLMVFVDALLDTRVGTLGVMSSELQAKVLADPLYPVRMLDDFDKTCGQGFTLSFKSRYRDRDLDVLGQSIATNMVIELEKMVVELEKAITFDPVITGYSISINYWPYSLDQQKIDDLVEMVRYRLTPKDKDGNYLSDLDIEAVSIPMKDLTIVRIRENWELVIMYDFVQWLESQRPNFKAGGPIAPRHSIVAPALFQDALPDKGDFLDADGKPMNPFHHTTRELSEWFRVEFWPVRLFTMIGLAEPDPKDVKAKA